MIEEIHAAQTGLPERRPRVLLNMASTVDGRASIGGRSGAIGDQADSEMLHSLRTIADALLIGAGTARAEGYADILRGEEDERMRVRRGLAAQPLTCIASRTLALDAETVPLLRERGAPVAILTPSEQTLPRTGAEIEYVRHARDGRLDLAAALAELRTRLKVSTLLCEGGPSLASDLLCAGLVDELFLCLAPKLAGGGPALRILAGADLDPVRGLELLTVHEHESELFLRYAVRS